MGQDIAFSDLQAFATRVNEYFPEYASITCVAVYRKSEKADLTAGEKRSLMALSEELRAAAASRREGKRS